MRPAEIGKHQRAEPFRPFRLQVSDGHHYDVVEPHFLLVSYVMITVGIGRPKDGVPPSSVYIQPLHITSIEFLPRSNGYASRRSRRTKG